MAAELKFFDRDLRRVRMRALSGADLDAIIAEVQSLDLDEMIRQSGFSFVGVDNDEDGETLAFAALVQHRSVRAALICPEPPPDETGCGLIRPQGGWNHVSVRRLFSRLVEAAE